MVKLTRWSPARPDLFLSGVSSPPRWRGRGLEASMYLAGFVCSFMLIPGNLIVAQLGAAGAPATIIGMGALVWWVAAQMSRSRSTLIPAQRIRLAMILFVLAILMSYVAASIRPMETVEQNSADRGLLVAAAWLGIVLLASDGLNRLTSIETVLRTLVVCGGIVAAIGLLQFLTGAAIVDVIQLPGLSPNNAIASVIGREGLSRVGGTATHPIEFGVGLAMVLPIALHFALQPGKHSRLYWVPIGAMAVMIPITLSRSTLLAVAAALLFLLPAWSRRRRIWAVSLVVAVVTAVYLAVPGLLGTFTRLFTGISDDGSVLSRTDSYDYAAEFVRRSPLIGRGFSTFLPMYRILDNQFLGSLIETGILGAAALVGLLITGITVALRARRGASEAVRSLGISLAASIAAAACGFATFDALGFAQTAFAFFLLLGVIGALAQLTAVGTGKASL